MKEIKNTAMDLAMRCAKKECEGCMFFNSCENKNDPPVPEEYMGVYEELMKMFVNSIIDSAVAQFGEEEIMKTWKETYTPQLTPSVKEEDTLKIIVNNEGFIS